MTDYDDFDYGDTPDFDLNDVLWGRDADEYAQALAWNAIVDGDNEAFKELVEYAWDEYGIDVEAEWDWVAFDEWYEAQ